MLREPLHCEGLRQKGNEEGARPAIDKEQLSQRLLHRVGLEDLLEALQTSQQTTIRSMSSHTHHLQVAEVRLQAEIQDEIQDPGL